MKIIKREEIENCMEKKQGLGGPLSRTSMIIHSIKERQI
jgi:hypothetical protein